MNSTHRNRRSNSGATSDYWLTQEWKKSLQDTCQEALRQSGFLDIGTTPGYTSRFLKAAGSTAS